MKNFSKWIGAGLGWTIGGPIGAILGFTFGTFVDSSNLERFEKNITDTTTGDFMVSFLVVVAAAMKADQRILKAELNYVKTHLVRYFGEEKASGMILMLRDILKQDIPLREVTLQIRSKMDYPSRLQLMHLICGIAISDGTVTQPEIIQIEQLGIDLGITPVDMDSLKNMFVSSSDWAYHILEVNRNTPDDEIKKKYRQLAMKNHPDKVAYLGDDVRKQAEVKFQKIKDAWEAIKKERDL